MHRPVRQRKRRSVPDKRFGQDSFQWRFWVVALLCVLYYSAIFPFQKYAVNMLQCNLVFTEVPEGSFWATNTVTVIQYVIMLVVAAAALPATSPSVQA